MLYPNEPFGVELQPAAYALDSTTINPCLSLFPWAKFRRHQAAIKLHTLLTLRGNFPPVVILDAGPETKDSQCRTRQKTLLPIYQESAAEGRRV